MKQWVGRVRGASWQAVGLRGGSPVIGHTQASGEGDARRSVQDPGSQEGRSNTGLPGLKKGRER